MDSNGKQPFWPLLRVVARSPFYSFGLLTFLVVAILAATNVVSKYALKSYTEDQIKRISWDAIVYQTSDVPQVPRMKKELSEIDGVSSVVETGSIKLSLGSYMHVNIGGGQTNIPWFMMIASDQPELLPPALRPVNGESVTALVGPQAMISPYLSNISVGNSLNILAENPPGSTNRTELFNSKIEHLATPERLEIVKFFLDKFGSAAFIPDGSLIVTVPKDKFDTEVPRLTSLVHEISKPQLAAAGESTEDEGPSRQGPEPETLGAKLLPEFMHLISVDRNRIFTGWDLDKSYQRAELLNSRITKVSSKISFDSFVNSELLVTLRRMSEVSKLIGVLAVLISFPILWLAWLFAGSLCNLIILNQRRMVGLLRLRGVSYQPIRTSLLTAIGAGGILGGLAGALAGTLVPYLLLLASGVAVPFGLLFTTIQEPRMLALFILVGTGLGLLAGRKVINYMSQITPLEASRRVASSEQGQFAYQFTKVQLLCLFFGGVKIFTWVAGITPNNPVWKMADNLLNFAGAALFLYGFAALIVSRREALQKTLSVIVTPLARDLHWFAVNNMLTRPHRIMATILVSALTFGVVVYPQITSKSFSEKTLRALKLNLGSATTVQFNAVDLTGGELALKPVGQYLTEVGGKVTQIEDQIKKSDPSIRNVGVLYEFSIPGGFYIPGKNYLQLYLVESPDQFLAKTYYENTMGVGRPFRDIMHDLGKDDVIISKGFASSLDPNNSQTLGLGSAKTGDISARIAGVVYLLPGLSQFTIQDRESFSSASVEFMNSIMQTEPYVVARQDSPNVARANGFLARVVVHVDGDDPGLVDQLGNLQRQGLIPPVASINTQEREKDRLSSDMFIYLALENIKVFMIGGMLVALAGLVAIAIVNFIEGKRIFALLRLRGASPSQLGRVVLSDLVAPLSVGACIGVPVGLVTGYGLTNAIFALPRAASILQILPVHLTLSWLVAAIVVGVLAFFYVSASGLSSWIFRKTAREALGS